MINFKTIEPYTGDPDIKRLIAAFKRESVDRVPNFEILIEDIHIEKMLGRYAGNTLSYGGDPAKGANAEQGRPMYPDDFLDLCSLIGQDAIMFDAGLWTPFKRSDAEGNLIPAYDRSVKNREDFDQLVLDTENAINSMICYIRQYREAIKRRNLKAGVGAAYGCLMQTPYEFLVGMNDFMMMVYEDRLLVEDILEVSCEHFVKITETAVSEGVDFIFPADDVAFKTGLFLPPKIMKEMWVPRMARIMEPAVNAGVPVIFHSDGKIDDIVEDVDADVKAHMDVLKPGYGYVATCSHSLVNYIPHENIIAYFNAIHKYGIYQ